MGESDEEGARMGASQFDLGDPFQQWFVQWL
jgi:hypothetical protein